MKYDIISGRIGIYIGCSVALIYTFFLETIQQIQISIIYFMLIFGIICLIDAIIAVDKKRRIERVKRLWK